MGGYAEQLLAHAFGAIEISEPYRITSVPW
jgi:hypothetical protein